MSSRKLALFPLNLVPWGPERVLLASTLSSFREDRHLAKTASPGRRDGGRGGRRIKKREGRERGVREREKKGRGRES